MNILMVDENTCHPYGKIRRRGQQTTKVIYKRENNRAIEVARKYGGRVSFVLAVLAFASLV